MLSIREMKKYVAAGIFMAVLFPFLQPVEAAVSESPTCVFMKFINKTRFQRLAPELKLSDLVLEKMVASGRFRLKETRPIDKKIEEQLYNENQRFADTAEAAQAGNFDKLFEESGEAASIDSAQYGQIVSPTITSAIGKEHGAEYLIQGTIVGIARGTEADHKYNGMAFLGGMIAGKIGGVGSVIGDIARDSKKTYTGTTLKNDIRIIKADTGEVVWQKIISCSSKQTKLKIGPLEAGSDQLNMNLYELALDQAAQKIVDELIAEMDKGKLFGSR